MNIEKSLALAVEGGYELKRSDRTSLNEQMAYLSINPDQVLLDPLFWQALGKSMGWYVNMRCNIKHTKSKMTEQDKQRFQELLKKAVSGSVILPTPKGYEGTCTMSVWHHFIDSLAEGKTVEEAMGIIYENPELITNL